MSINLHTTLIHSRFLFMWKNKDGTTYDNNYVYWKNVFESRWQTVVSSTKTVRMFALITNHNGHWSMTCFMSDITTTTSTWREVRTCGGLKKLLFQIHPVFRRKNLSWFSNVAPVFSNIEHKVHKWIFNYIMYLFCDRTCKFLYS